MVILIKVPPSITSLNSFEAAIKSIKCNCKAPFTGALNVVGERTPGREAGEDQMRNDKPLPVKLPIPRES